MRATAFHRRYLMRECFTARCLYAPFFPLSARHSEMLPLHNAMYLMPYACARVLACARHVCYALCAFSLLFVCSHSRAAGTRYRQPSADMRQKCTSLLAFAVPDMSRTLVNRQVMRACRRAEAPRSLITYKMNVTC